MRGQSIRDLSPPAPVRLDPLCPREAFVREDELALIRPIEQLDSHERRLKVGMLGHPRERELGRPVDDAVFSGMLHLPVSALHHDPKRTAYPKVELGFRRHDSRGTSSA
jgi:hypothetical protein